MPSKFFLSHDCSVKKLNGDGHFSESQKYYSLDMDICETFTENKNCQKEQEIRDVCV